MKSVPPSSLPAPQLPVLRPLSQSGLLLGVTRALEQASIEHCVLAGYDRLMEGMPVDIDLMVRPTDFGRLAAVLAEAGREAGALLIHSRPSEPAEHFFALAALTGDRLVLLNLDIITDYRRHGRVWLRADRLLARRRRHALGFPIPAPDDAFAYYLIRKLEKGGVSARQADELTARFLEAPRACRNRLHTWLPEPSADLVADAAQSGDWHMVRLHLPRLRAQLQYAAPGEAWWEALSKHFAHLRRQLRRWFAPEGLWVAVVGPDGVSRAEVIRRLMDELGPAFPQVLYPSPQSGSPVARGWMSSLLMLVCFAAESLGGQGMRLRRLRAEGALLLTDHGYRDLLANPGRYGYRGPMMLARGLAGLMPEPDLWLVLDAPLEAGAAPLASDGSHQAEAYRRLADTRPVALRIEGWQSPAEATTEAGRAILLCSARRTLRRLHLRPVPASRAGLAEPVPSAPSTATWPEPAMPLTASGAGLRKESA